MADTLVMVPGQEGQAGRAHTSALCTQAALVPHPLPGPMGTPVVFFGSGAAASPEPGALYRKATGFHYPCQLRPSPPPSLAPCRSLLW